MSLRESDKILVDPEAILYIEKIENLEKLPLSKFEIIEHFFDWLKESPKKYQLEFL